MNIPTLTQQHPLTAVVAFCFFIAAFLPFSCWANQQNASKIERIQHEIRSKQEQIKSTEEQKISIQKELYKMDNVLKVGQQKLNFLQDRLVRQEGHIKEKEGEIARIQAEKDTVGQHVKNRLRSFYQVGEISIINTLFSASNLPELLNLKQYFQAMFRYDQQILQRYSTHISLLAGARAEIKKEKHKLLEVILEAKKQEEMIIAARLARTTLLKRVQTEETLYRHALREIKIAANNLTEEISTLSVKVIRPKKRKIAMFKSNKKIRPSARQGFSSMQGKLTPPAPGKVLKYFGTYTDKFDTNTTSTGINIETPQNTKVTSIYPGTVVLAGTMIGYGTMAIIDHGGQYHSIISGLDSIRIKKNDQVTAGQTLGIMGTNTTLLSQGLHFEIRHDSQPVDPLLWLDTSKLIITEEQYRFE